MRLASFENEPNTSIQSGFYRVEKDIRDNQLKGKVDVDSLFVRK